MFAVEIQVHFVKASKLPQLCLPGYWDLFEEARKKSAVTAAALGSPGIARDAEILELLATSYQ